MFVALGQAVWTLVCTHLAGQEETEPEAITEFEAGADEASQWNTWLRT